MSTKKGLVSIAMAAILGCTIGAIGAPIIVAGTINSCAYNGKVKFIHSQIPNTIKKRERGLDITIPQIGPTTQEKLNRYDYFKSQEHYWNNVMLTGYAVTYSGIGLVGIGAIGALRKETDDL